MLGSAEVHTPTFLPYSSSILQGMVVLSASDVGVSCRRFVARFCLLSHSVKELCVGFQGTGESPKFLFLCLKKRNTFAFFVVNLCVFLVYVGALRRTVTIVDFAAASLRCGAPVDVTFEFYGAPAFVRCGAPMFFRERDTKGTGEVVAVDEAQETDLNSNSHSADSQPDEDLEQRLGSQVEQQGSEQEM